jgi:K+-transporting ATPase ATPase A chain
VASLRQQFWPALLSVPLLTLATGTLPCDTLTFGVLVLGVVLLVGALCFLPALALGPIAGQFQPASFEG